MAPRGARNFERNEVANLVRYLKKACKQCPNTKVCRTDRSCPVMRSREIISDYTNGGPAVIPKPAASRLPTGAKIDHEPLHRLLERVQEFCGPCVYHVNACFLNRTYALTEQALERPARKPIARKPREV